MDNGRTKARCSPPSIVGGGIKIGVMYRQKPGVFRVLFDVGDASQRDGGRLEGLANLLEQRHRRVGVLEQTERSLAQTVQKTRLHRT